MKILLVEDDEDKRDDLSIFIKEIVVTQFDLFGKGEEEITLKELDQQLYQNFPNIYFGAIQFSVSLTGWEEDLYSKIKNLIKL